MTTNIRRLAPRERRLLERMLSAAHRLDVIADLSSLMVEELEDGGMGSLLFSPPKGSRVVGTELVEAQFEDADGVLVSAVVNLDSENKLYELDIWKVDFSKLQCLPGDGDVVEFHFGKI